MNPQDTSSTTEVMNDTEMYAAGTFIQTEVIEVPASLYWAEFVCLAVVVVFGLALWRRRRQACALLLPLAALLLAMSMLPGLLTDVPALQSYEWIMRMVPALTRQTWLRPVGALLLAIYALMQWRGAGRGGAEEAGGE